MLWFCSYGWSKAGGRTPAVLPNKVVTPGSVNPRCSCSEVALPSGHGGEGEGKFCAAQCLATTLLAGHGGEEELGRARPLLDLDGDPGLLPSCERWSRVPSQYSLACRGGEEGSGCGISVLRLLQRRLPERCYGAALIGLLRESHTVSLGAVILGRHGGPTSTSRVEVLSRVDRRSSALLHRQVVRPRRWRSDRRMRYGVGSVLSSILAPKLDVSVLSSPAICGGATHGLDCVLTFPDRVFSANLGVPSLNFRFLSVRVVKGLLCNMYLPRVMNEMFSGSSRPWVLFKKKVLR